MKKTYYPRLDETLCKAVLPNGLTVMVVPKPGFSRKIAYFMTDYGSIHTKYARELAELLPLLTSLWLLPAVFPATREQMRDKFRFLGEMLENMGVPLFDEQLWRVVDAFFDQLPGQE